MKTGTVVLVGLAALAFFKFTGLGVAAGTYQIVFSGVSFQGLTQWTIKLIFQNVSNSNIQLNSLAGNLSVNGSYVANVSDFNAVVIPANSQKEVDITLTPSLLSLPTAVIDFINNPSAPVAFTIQGNANIDNLVLPFDLDYTFNAPNAA